MRGLIFGVISSVCFLLSQSTIVDAQAGINTDLFAKDIDTNKDLSISQDEVSAFYQRRWGTGDVSRCQFVNTMLDKYTTSSAVISVLYDVMRAGNSGVLSEQQFTDAILMGENAVSVASFKERTNQIFSAAISLENNPQQNTQRLTPNNIEDFDVERLANTFDENDDGVISPGEISFVMRTQVDTNKDNDIERCEFVDTMTSYNQHPVVASRVYDVIFTSRDTQWADVDSLFLEDMIDVNGDSHATKEEMIHFFTYTNLKEAGQLVLRDGTLAYRGGASILKQSFQICSFSLALAVLQVARIAWG